MSNFDKWTYVEKLVHAGYHSLARNLEYYWPADNSKGDYSNEIPENNIVVNLANVFLNEGFLVYLEVPFRRKGRRNIDLICVSIEHQILVKVEAKGSMYWPEKIIEDIDRILDFSMTDYSNSWAPGETPDFDYIVGLIVAATPDKYIAEWWQSLQPDSKPQQAKSQNWDALINKVIENDGFAWTIPLRENFNLDDRWRVYRGCYAMFELDE